MNKPYISNLRLNVLSEDCGHHTFQFQDDPEGNEMQATTVLSQLKAERTIDAYEGSKRVVVPYRAVCKATIEYEEEEITPTQDDFCKEV